MSRIFAELVNAGVPQHVALAIDAGFDARTDSPAAYTGRLGVVLLEASERFGGRPVEQELRDRERVA